MQETALDQELSDLAFGKDVTVTVQDIDRYGRMVAGCTPAHWT